MSRSKNKISYERLEKITSKLEKSIASKDIESFRKWYRFVKKELIDGYFYPLLVKHLNILAKNSDICFFSSLLRETKEDLKEDFLFKILPKILQERNIDCYKEIKEVFGNEFYMSKYFEISLTYSLIGNFYMHKFNYDFENILKLHSYDKIHNFCNFIHLNGVEDESMTNILFSNLLPEERTVSLEKNLIKSIQNSNIKDIEFFYIKLIKEYEVTSSLKDKLLIASLHSSIVKGSKNNDDLKHLIAGGLKEDMLSVGGIFFKSLLEKIELKDRLEKLSSKEESKRAKI